jgi:hypothetical protein
MNTDPIVGQCQFTDGATREVYLDAEGQYGLDNDGEKVRGVWLPPVDEADRPLIVRVPRLATFAVVAISALGSAPGCGPATEEERAALAIKKLGGEVRREDDKPGRPVHYANLKGCPVTDGGMKDVLRLPNLRYLNLADTKVTEEGLKEIGRLRGLHILILAGTDATDATLVEVGTLAELSHLDVSGTNVTDAGLAELRGLAAHLSSVDLSHTAVSDAGLRWLYGLKLLIWVDLTGTDVTEAGVKALRAALPLCEVER